MNADLVVHNARIVRHEGEFLRRPGSKGRKDRLAIGTDEALPHGKRDIDAQGLV